MMDKVEKMKISSNVSQTLATARIWCLLSIVAAHVSYAGTFAGAFWNRLGTIGVVLYLFMSGYLFQTWKFENLWILIKRKVVSVGVPWLCLGTLTWVYNAILSTQFRSALGYIKWMLGNGTYLYYIPVIFVCFLIFYKAPKWSLFAAIFTSIISVLVTAMGLLDSTISFLGINHYLNPLNWIGFFALGMIVQGIDSELLYNFLKKIRWLSIGIFAVAFIVLMVFSEVRFDYFSYVAIPYELLGGLAVLSISTFKITKFSLFDWLSRFSFSIYLIHMIFVGLLDGLFGKYEATRILFPVCVIAVSFLLLLIGWLFSKKLRIEKTYSIITGGRV